MSADEALVEFGLMVKRLRREEKRWSQETLAEKAGIDQGTVSAIERAIGQPTTKTVIGLANAFGASPQQFLQMARIVPTTEEAPGPDVYATAPLGDILSALKEIPTVPAQLEQLAGLTPRVRETIIRSLARTISLQLGDSLRLAQQAQLDLDDRTDD